MLYWQQFEELVCSLGLRLFGASLTRFKPGRDGGRDARFEGTPTRWPSESNQEHGKYVLQCKHSSKVGSSCSDNDFKTEMKGETRKVRKLIIEKELSHYLVFTNRAKSAAEDQDFRTEFGRIKGLSKAWLIGGEHLHSLLNEHLDIWERYEEEVRNPVRFNREDLIKVIHSFAVFIKRDNGQPRADSLRHLKLEDKNEVNGLSAHYFSDLKRHSMPQFEQIRSFLENPRHERYLDLYRDTADDLRGRLRTMLFRSDVPSLEEGFERIRREFIATDNELSRKRRFVRIFLDYMYSNCDIGQNVDTTQAPQA